MIWTLQRYISRELFKTFALTAIGLTLTFSLCGGAMNMIEAEVLSAVEMIRILTFVLPVAVTMMLPVSALFACAIVYGRFAADNEFDACRASGVNINRLLAPAMALSIGTCIFTFTFVNYILPSFVERLDEMVRKDVHKIVTQALATRGYFSYGPYVLSAGRAEAEESDGDGHNISIRNARFMEIERGNLTRAGTADQVYIQFWADAGSNEPIASAVMYDIRALDIQRLQYYQLREQAFDPMMIPSPLHQDPKWLNLPDLIYFRNHPAELAVVQRTLTRIRRLVRESVFYRHMIEELTGPDRMLRLGGEQRSYELRAERVSPDRVDPSLDDFRPRLQNATIIERWPGGERRYSAEWCSVRVEEGYRGGADQAQILLQNVEFTDARDLAATVSRRRVDLEPVPIPAFVAEEEARIPDDVLIGTDAALGEDPEPLGLGRQLDDVRVNIHRELIRISLRINGIIHSRLAFSFSVLVTLVLAAALGIIFRGGQFLTAFVISFIPGLIVVVLNIMGRQLAKDVETVTAGIGAIWGGIVLLGIADVIILKWFLRR